MKITDNQIREIASKIPIEYNYMDKLSEDGWAWEFLRRDKKYLDWFRKYEKIVAAGAWNDECEKKPPKREEEEIDSYTAMLPIIKINGDARNYLKVNPPYTGDSAMGKKYNIRTEYFIPRPSKRFIDLDPPPMFFPRKKDYIIYGSFKDLLNASLISEYNPDCKDSVWRPNLERDDEDAFYIHISKYAKIKDLKGKLLTDISKFLDKQTPKLRQKKWKFYLIVYDLKQEYKNRISFDTISDILIEAYRDKDKSLRKSLVVMRNMDNWYSSAESLINGGFKKYLRPTVFRTRSKQKTPPAK